VNKHQQRSEATRSRILDAAEQCFAQNGYDGTGVALICQTAGVSKGAFYHHFEGKQVVFLALLNRWLSTMDTQIQTLGVNQTNPVGRLAAASRIVGQLSQVPNEQLLIYLAYLNKAARDPKAWQATKEPYYRYQAFVRDLVHDGIEEGAFHPANPATISRIVIALVMGLLIQGYLDPEGADWEKVTDQGFNILLKGMGR
jgi:AcrR family transcriptional regulator